MAIAETTVTSIPPTLIYKLLEQTQLGRDDAPMLPEKIAAVINRFGPVHYTIYGQTEAPMTITALSAEEMARPDLHASVGRACSLSEVAVLDAQGKPVAPMHSGDIGVRGGIVMPSYFQAAEQSTAVFHEDWLITGDLGYLDEQGYLFLQGRNSDLIITGGFNVYPAEVENALMTLPQINECVVFATEDGYWGQRIEAAVCLNAGYTEDNDTLRAAIRPLLGEVKTPKKIHFLESLPRNPVGKIVRRDIQALCS